MTKIKPIQIINLIVSIILGSILIYGGLVKFSKPNPKPTEVVIKAQKFEKPSQTQTLQKILYIYGMKQTNYLWQFLAIMEIICGLLLISQVFTLFGAIMAFPIVINIFLFHLYLEFDEIGELIESGFYLAINIWLLVGSFKKIKSIIYQPEKLNFIINKK